MITFGGGDLEEHQRFLRWRLENPKGRVLNLLGRNRARLHRSKCKHFTIPDHPEVRLNPLKWGNEVTNTKICGPAGSGLQLKQLAIDRGMRGTHCRDC